MTWRFVKAVLPEPKLLVFEYFVEEPPGPGEIVAATVVSAVSTGTESAAYEGQPPLRDGVAYPRLVGYCNVARVLAVGEAVTGLTPGSLILTNESHRSGFRIQQEGVLAVLDPSISIEGAALSYITEIGLASLQKARLAPTEHVAVVGLGLLGLATIAVASSFGADVAGIASGPQRLERARQMGACLALEARDPQVTEAVTAALGGIGPDVIVTTANRWSLWETALCLSRRATRIAVTGFPGRTEGPPRMNPLNSRHVYAKQLEILGAGMAAEGDPPAHQTRFTLKRNLDYILRCVARGRIPLDKLITDRLDWSQLETVYQRRIEGDHSMLGAILRWDTGY